MTDFADQIPSDPAGTMWDVVVVGTGAGGASAGFNLARLGRSVLFLERGKLLTHDGVTNCESRCPKEGHRVDPVWWPDRVYERTDRGDVLRPMPMGCGTGGSTALFAMVMDRFRPVDLTARSMVQNPANTSLPNTWPISYEELEPYYRQAEALFRVRGTDDPLMPTRAPLLEPPAPSETETAVHDTLIQAGLHPYRLHYAREHVPGCTGCFAQLCPHECRNDAGRICLAPALKQHGAHLLPDCRVLRLRVSGRTVHEASCVWKGRYLAIRARVFVLALNSVQTPALLLQSCTASFSNGLGNSSGMVGRNLMLHVSDSLLVRFAKLRGPLNDALNHGISLNDFYVCDGIKLGNVHAHAVCLPIPSTDSEGTAVFHTIVEDFPYMRNRITFKGDSDGELVWEYHYPDELRDRSKMLVTAFAKALGSTCDITCLQPPGALNIAHACGTCRFGDDPRTSVLDRENRIHDLDNVYVVDGSFLPSSSGMHPSLTIVANSLRVSARIALR